MGEVWKACDLVRKVDVAVKFPVESEVPAQGELDRFRFEAQVSAHLGRVTPHIVTVHDLGSDDSLGPFLVMDYVRGRTLEEEMVARGPLEPERVRVVLAQIAEALSAAHEAGIVHRDLKPSNVLLATDPEGGLDVKLTDFGVAKAVRRELGVDYPMDTCFGLVLGTPAYLSPEQLQARRAGEGSDRWALAVLAYEALTGRKPFSGRSLAQLLSSVLTRPTVPLSKVRPGLPVALDAWFARALAKRAADRFHSLEPMVEAFQRALQPASALRAPGSLGPRAARWAAVARSALAAAGLLGALTALRPVPQEPGEVAAVPEAALERGAAGAARRGMGGAPIEPASRSASYAPGGPGAARPVCPALPSAAVSPARPPPPRARPGQAEVPATPEPRARGDKSAVF
jgi:serine/threonine-protein kinase